MLEEPCVSLTCQFLFVECCKSLLIKQFTRCFEKILKTFHQLNDLLLELKKLVFINFSVMFVENDGYNSQPLAGFFKRLASAVRLANMGVVISVHLLWFVGFVNVSLNIESLVGEYRQKLCLGRHYENTQENISLKGKHIASDRRNEGIYG